METTTEDWLDLLYSWDEGDEDVYVDNQYTEYNMRHKLASFDKTFTELENFISKLSVEPSNLHHDGHAQTDTVFEHLDVQTIVIFCGLGTNTLLLALLLVGLAIKLRYFRECWRNWPRLWLVSALTGTHILILLWVQLRKSSLYNGWATKGLFSCLILSSIETMLCFGAILYIVLLAVHTCFQVFLPRFLIGPRQFVMWVSMTIFIWIAAIPIAVFVRKPYTGIYESMYRKHCLMDSESGFISLMVYTYAIPFCLLFGMICTCIIGVCNTTKITKESENKNHVITTDVMILRWIRMSRTWSIIFVAVLTSLSFIARVPLFVARVYRPYSTENCLGISQAIYFGHYALAPFCMLILKDVRDLFSSICICCECGCCCTEESTSNVQPLSIIVR